MIPEPLLMHCQNGPLNQDTYAQQQFIELRDKFGLTTAIETGTCLGYTTRFLAENFTKVKTVEISDLYFNIAKTNRLKDLANVEMHLGSSSELMETLLVGVDDKTLIFLDAHWGDNCPLKLELEAIAAAGIKPVIAIHDFLVPGKPELGYDSINNQPFTYEWLKPEFDKIYGPTGYNYFYNSKAEGAMRGIIYIIPII